MKSINPTNEQLIAEYELISNSEVDRDIAKSQKAYKNWRKLSFKERGSYLAKLAELLKSKKNELARLMAEEMGKPLEQGISEVEKCIWACDYYVENAAEFLKPDIIESDAEESYVVYKPLGIVLAIMPWNFPLWQVIRFAAPALMAGNVALLKHSPNVQKTAEELEKCFAEAGFPEGCFTNLRVDEKQVERIIENDLVKAVTLTGSTKAGKAVAANAGANLKKTVLELGGSDPYIILDDADVKAAAKLCVTSRLINNGQSCIAAKRFTVVDSVVGEFTNEVKSLMSEKTVGDPLDENTDIGPLARKDLMDQLHEQVKQSIGLSAKAILGGKPLNSQGYFYPPTILVDVPKNSPAYKDELFGPVASIISVKDEREAIDVANSTAYGLGSAIFSSDIKRAKKISEEEIEAGSCFVNDFVKSDPRLPFGGINESGYGRELGPYGIKEFVNTKTISIG